MNTVIKKNNFYRRHNSGYTLLFAVLTATIVLGVAVFIVDISRKQYELSVSARNSMYSFYAADSAIECAVSGANWASISGFSSTTGGNLNCAGSSMSLVNVGVPSISPSGLVVANGGNPVRQYTGYIALPFAGNTTTINQCAQLTFTTGWDTVGSRPVTVIDSRGYNFCTSGIVAPDVSNPATVERALRLIQYGVW